MNGDHVGQFWAEFKIICGLKYPTEVSGDKIRFLTKTFDQILILWQKFSFF